MLEELTTVTIFHFFMIFCRLGSALMVLPGFGEIYVSARSRLVLALTLSVVLTPILETYLPPVPTGTWALAVMLITEVLTGIFIGALGRMVQSILHVAGMVIAFQSSLAAAMLFDANQGSQGSVIGNFMTLVGLTLLFATDLHHVMLLGIAESYTIFEAGAYPPVAGFAELAMRTMSGGFVIAVKIASPLIVVGLCLYLGAGIMARLMPSMQVFFVMIPIQIYVAFTIMAISLSAGMMWYLEYFQEVMSILFTGEEVALSIF